MQDPNTRRIVLLGKSGSGKSSLANTIFGGSIFKVNHSSDSKTRFSEAQTKTVSGQSLTLIDTPGIFNVDRSEKEVRCEIFSCMTECAPGPHAFLFVLLVEKFTEQEQAIIDQFKKHFGDEALRYTTVVFTHGDQLPDDMQITEFVSQSKGLNELVQRCGGRCHVVDYRYWKNKPDDEYRSNQYQVAQILSSIEKTVTPNNGGIFTNEMLQKIERDIQEEQKHLSEGTSLEESREQAKAIVLQKYIDNASKTPKYLKYAAVIVGGVVAVVAIYFAAKKIIKLVKPTGPPLPPLPAPSPPSIPPPIPAPSPPSVPPAIPAPSPPSVPPAIPAPSPPSVPPAIPAPSPPSIPPAIPAPSPPSVPPAIPAPSPPSIPPAIPAPIPPSVPPAIPAPSPLSVPPAIPAPSPPSVPPAIPAPSPPSVPPAIPPPMLPTEPDIETPVKITWMSILDRLRELFEKTYDPYSLFE